MSREILNKEIGKYTKALWNNEITEEKLMKDLRDVCFIEPKVDAQQFLDVVRQYDKNFAPVPEGPEVQKRAEIMKKAQDRVLKYAMHERDVDIRGLKFPEGKQLARRQYVLLRDGTQEQKQAMTDLLLSGDKKAVGEYLYNRLGANKDRLFSLLEMNDEQLVENYFEHADDMALIAELQMWMMDDCEFTPDQKKVMDEIYDNMTRFACLTGRVNMMANPYYAKYPIETMKVPEDNLLEFQDMMANIAAGAMEKLDDPSNKDYLRGPTHLLAYDYYGLRTFLSGASMTQIESYLKPFGKKYGEVLWANYKGTPMNKEWATSNLLEGKVVFVSIPGGGAKALYNTATNPLDFKLEEAPGEVLSQYMQTISQNARVKVANANPFFLSMFSGSKEFNAMEKCMKEAEAAQKALEGMKYPLDMEDPKVRAAIVAIGKLGDAHKAYMERKEGQGLQQDAKGNLIGRTENEVKRLAAADEAESMYKTLKFQLEYQISPESTHGRMQKDAADLEAKRAAEDAKTRNAAWRNSATTAKEVINPLTEEEKSKSTKAQMLDNNIYVAMPACKESDAGKGLVTLQNEVKDAVNLLAARAGMNREMSESVQRDMRTYMARLVLFDYVLKERVAVNGPNSETVQAGTVEQAMNKEKFATKNVVDQLATSEAFKQVIGKVTPARIEAFLNGKESRNNKFNAVVQEGLGIAKPNVNVAANQGIQQQPTAVMNAPKPEVPQAPTMPPV